MAETPERLKTALADRYTIERELGAGGMATVYLAHDVRHDRPVALKVLRPELSAILGGERFLAEIKTTANLQHPHILSLYDSGEAEGLVFYVMPFVEGESLRDRLTREKQLPLEDALRIAREVGDALSHAHAHQIIHRDIKPANILLSGGHALVADFGIARAITAAGGEQITTSGLAVGTPAYMSPEQASAKDPVDQRTDVYALGCVVYEMLAGQPPFTGATAQAVLAQHRLEHPPSLEVVRPGVGHGVQHVVDKALAKAPADRFQTVAEFVVALEQAAISPESGEYVPARRGVRWWWRWVAAGGVLAVSATLAIWAPWAPPVRLDSNKVAGFPLRALGGVTRDVTDQVYTVIENALVHTDPLKWVPGARWLARGGAEPAIVTVDLASSVARRQGARYWITGTVTAAGDSISVALELYDAGGDSLVDRVVAAGLSSVPAYTLGLRAINALLPKIVGRSTHVDQVLLEGFAPRAVVHWLAGERAYREARYDTALAQYEQALAVDSGMVFAALKGATTAAWLADYALGARLVTVALTRQDRLPERNVRFAHGLRFFFEGDGDSALAWFRAALRADSGWSEAWYGVGEVYLHLSPSGVRLDSLAQDAFSRSLAIDPDFAPVVFHLAELALSRGELAPGDSLVRRYRLIGAGSAETAQLDLMRKCVHGGPGAVEWTDIAAHFPNEALTAGRLFAGGARYPACARAALLAAFRSPQPDGDYSRVVSAARGLHHLDIAQGRVGRAVALADSLGRLGGPLSAGYGLLILDAVIGVVPDERAAPGLALLQVPLETATARHLWWLGAWAVNTRDVARVDSVAVRLARLADETNSATCRTEALAMAAWSALLHGDTAVAVARFESLRPVAPVSMLVYDSWEPLAAERLQLAELLFARRDYAGAIQVAESFDRAHALVDLVFLPASLRLRRRAAERLGDRVLAAALTTRLRNLVSSSS